MNPTPQPETRLTPAQAAQLIGVKETTLSVWRCTRAQQLPYLKINRRVMYLRSDVDAFLRARTCHMNEVAA